GHLLAGLHRLFEVLLQTFSQWAGGLTHGGKTTLAGMRRGTKFALAGSAALALGAFGYATLVERVRYTLRRWEVPVLAEDTEPLRVLQISDLHMTPGQRGKQEWVASLAALDPDLVL